MPFADFSGPPNAFGNQPETCFRGKSYAVCSFFGSVHLLNAHECFLGGSPTPFVRKRFSLEVLCRLLNFRVRTADFGSSPKAFFEDVLCRLLIFRVRTPFGV